jgi:hypothetical protein
MKTLLFGLLLAPALSLACGDASFGPEYSADPCPEIVTPTGIPLAGHDREIWIGARPDGSSRGMAPVTGYVVDGFAVLVATLPNGLKVAGISNQCVDEYCPNLGEWARQDLQQRIDLLARFAFMQGE